MDSIVIGTPPRKLEAFFTQTCPAAQLGPEERKRLSLQVLARTEPVTSLSAKNGVSRKFLYHQAEKAEEALDEAFAPSLADDEVLFYFPVTKKWIRQFVLALVLICHSSFRGVMELLRDLFDYPISLGSVHNIVKEATEKAREINGAQELSQVRVGAHDEIFQARKPVLVGADVESTYCYLLVLEDHRDEDTWGVHILDLADQGLNPNYTIADAGRGLRAGQRAALPHVPCHGDVFHAERDFGHLAFYLENRAAGCTSAREKLDRKMDRAKQKGRGHTLSKRLALARKAEEKAVELARDVRALADWMKNDILSLAGPQLAQRRELFDFVTGELAKREHLSRHRIKPVRRALENQRDNLLAFAGVLDEKIDEISRRLDVPAHLTHKVCELQGMDELSGAHWELEAQLHGKLKGRFHDVQEAVRKAMDTTPRASSIAENLNSRLRNYFFLRRHIGDDYLEFLRFFLNHRRFLRSDRPERVGKSPAELLSGEAHPHWLEMLGFERFQRKQSA